MLKVRKIAARTRYSVTTEDGSEVEVNFEPLEWPNALSQRIGDKLVVAYVTPDNDGSSSNPMENNDCQGNIYTKPSYYARDGSNTDNMGELLDALQLDGENEVRPGVVFAIDGVTASLEDHAVTEFMETNYGHDLTDEWLLAGGSEPDREDDDRSILYRDEIEAEILNGEFKYDEHQALMLALYARHWREIVGPYVVPISYCSSNHGPGTASASPCKWDGDADDLPDGVWVADKGAIENIDHSPLPRNVTVKYSYREKCWRVLHEVPHARRAMTGDIQGSNTKFDDHMAAFAFAHTLGEGDIGWQAELYAKGVLEEYVSWCNGDVYGCCVETFVKTGPEDDDWESVEADECWGFIGSDHAEQSLLDDFFTPALDAIKETA